MAYQTIEEMEFFRWYVEVADQVWKCVEGWKPFERDTVGKQLVHAADSVGANLVEGDGRYSAGDALHFFIIARASARETRYWIQRAVERNLLPQDKAIMLLERLTDATRLLNNFIHYRRQHRSQNQIKEEPTDYQT